MARFDLDEARQDYREAIGVPVRLTPHKKDEDMTTESTLPDSPLAKLRERSLAAAFSVGARDMDEAIKTARKLVDFALGKEVATDEEARRQLRISLFGLHINEPLDHAARIVNAQVEYLLTGEVPEGTKSGVSQDKDEV